MSSPHVSLLGLYHYDALDRLASIVPAGQEVVRRFYLNNRLTTAMQGASRHSVVQAEDLLLALHRVESDQVFFAVLATDQANSVLHSLEAMRNQAFVYSPYGTRSPQTASSGVPGFTGQAIDPLTGHYLLGNGVRAFNPTLMRFNSPDTLSPFAEGGLNSYTYCFGDPVNCTDPTGQSPFLRILVPAYTRAKDFFPHLLKAKKTGDVGFIKTARQAMTRNKGFSGEMTGARRYLDESIAGLDNRSPPFVQKLDAVNKNLASYGDQNLSLPHAKKYAALARQVSTGEISNTSAHFKAARVWSLILFKEGPNPAPIVGMAFNMAGGLASGTVEHGLQKTGKALRQSSQRVRQP